MQSKKNKTPIHNANDSTSANPATQFLKKWWWLFLVVIVVVVLLLCIKPLKDALSDTEPTFHLDTTPTVEYTTCKVGETFDANGLHITYLGVEEWLPKNETSHPKDGYGFIRLKVAAENKCEENREIYDIEFTCYVDDARQVMEYFTEDRLPGGIIAPGERVEGYIYYTIPLGGTTNEIVYESILYWRNHRVILPVELTY